MVGSILDHTCVPRIELCLPQFTWAECLHFSSSSPWGSLDPWSRYLCLHSWLCLHVIRWSSGPEERSGSTDTESGFDSMNKVVARLLTDLTASMRFAGDLNVDLNEITTNLVPFSRLHYLLSSLSPFPASPETRSRRERGSSSGIGAHESTPRRMRTNQMFSEAFSSSHQLLQAEPRSVMGV